MSSTNEVDSTRPPSCVGGLKVVEGRCDTCVFSKASPVRSGRLRRLAQSWQRQDTHQVCHQFPVAAEGDDGEETGMLDGENVVCGGFFDNVYLVRGTGQLLRIAERFGGFEYVPAPTIHEMSQRTEEES